MQLPLQSFRQRKVVGVHACNKFAPGALQAVIESRCNASLFSAEDAQTLVRGIQPGDCAVVAAVIHQQEFQLAE